eukprot:TRINITY_DN169_c0_g1_i1.p1 TRINITY_DN169_c0_g1~~TRINITY_DN169_c0_g1_i1.p1  ORF type:complete len:478 (-),score=229.87 TRINITY_DN169_c0_g1_i1:228-1580(-)
MASFVPADGKAQPCAGCGKTVYPNEALRALTGVWHKGCLKCSECAITLNLATVQSFENKPYCKTHKPAHKATQVADKTTQSALSAPRAAGLSQGVDKTQRMTFAPGRGGPIRARGARGGAGAGGATHASVAAAGPGASSSAPRASPAAAAAAAPRVASPAASAPRGISTARPGAAPKFGSQSNKCPICEKTVYAQEELKFQDRSYHKACFKCSTCQLALNFKTAQSFQNIVYCAVHLPKQSHTQVASVEMQNALKAPKGARAAQGVNKAARTTFAPGMMKAVRPADVKSNDSADAQSRLAPSQSFQAPEPTPHLNYEERDSGLTGAADKFAKLSVQSADAGATYGYSNDDAYGSAPAAASYSAPAASYSAPAAASYQETTYDDQSYGDEAGYEEQAYEEEGGYEEQAYEEGGYEEEGYAEEGYEEGYAEEGYEEGYAEEGYEEEGYEEDW